jgi:tRNA1(Val) A37 N6-methylase TrmN6
MVTKRDTFKAFYTKSNPIVEYMVNRLHLHEGHKVFEPCAGDGVFIDALLAKTENLSIDAYELDTNAYRVLNNKNYSEKVRLKLADTLTSEELYVYAQSGGIYDRIIANPPYGAWQSFERRKLLKKLYPNFYVKETYTLFLYRCLQLLKPEGILVFIIPDTFLNLHLHVTLREIILTKSKIKDIALIPSHFFPGVNFGYANLAIITLSKGEKIQENLANWVKVYRGFEKVSDLTTLSPKLRILESSQETVYKNPSHAFFISNNHKVIELLSSSSLRVGDVADCITGFYSGDDKAYLRVANPNVKNAKNYLLLNPALVKSNYLEVDNLLSGIEGLECFLPIVKGGNTPYLKLPEWYIDWGKLAVNNYKTDKKARFQNAEYYFRTGIGVPMVSSKQITASLMENSLFDQSIVGIFPKDEILTYYLLAFFNSPTCNQLIRTINPSANNPANYLKKIPLIIPDDYILGEINMTVEEILDGLRTGKNFVSRLQNRLDSIFKELYGF